jgi:hypothetical protein
MDSDTTSSPVDAPRSLVTAGKRHRTTKGKPSVPNQKAGDARWGWRKGNVNHRTIQQKSQKSTEAKAHGMMAGVKQQGYGDPCGGNMVGSSRQKGGMEHHHKKATRMERVAKDRPFKTNGDCRKMGNLEVAPRQPVPRGLNPQSEGRWGGMYIRLS